MKKNDSFLRQNRYIFISFFLTAFLWLLIYLVCSIGVLGSNTILRMDLYHQYCPLFAELYDKIISGNFSSYSWESGLGSSFWGNYFNYLSSPVGFIVALFGHKNVPEAIAAMILIKGALSAAAFTYYIKKSQHNTSISSVIFGILYSFCGYVLAYYWDLMWLDAVVLLPLVLLGIERIINNGYIWTFCGSLALTMFSNYYMSYMLCIFSVIYFFYYYAISYPSKAVLNSNAFPEGKVSLINKLRNSRFFRSGFRFAIAALLTGGIMAVVLIPTYTILQACSATSSSFPSEMSSYFNFFDFFANHISSLETTIRSSGDDVLPNVYCGMLTVVLAPMFFFTRTISKKEKISTILVLAILFVSFNTNYLNYIWHGFHFPNDLPYRFSFIYSFILLIVAYKTFIRLNEFTSRQIGISGTAVTAMIILITKVGSKNVEDRTIYISLIFAVIYTVVLTVFKDKKYEKSAVAFILCLFVWCEVIVADTQAIKNTVTKESYEADYEEFRTIKNTLDTIENGDTSYRMELSDLRTRMDGCWFGYNGASVFSSMAYEATAKLEDRLGEMSNGINSFTYNPQTPVFNMMHSIKYVVQNNDIDVFSDNRYYSHAAEYGKYTAYKNNYYLPIAYGVSNNIEKWDTSFDINADYVNPFILQGEYFDLATGAGNPFKEINVSFISYNNVNAFTEDLNAGSYTFNKTTADSDGSATFYFRTDKPGNVYIFYNVDSGSEKEATFNSDRNTINASCAQDYIVDMGHFEKGQTITASIPFEANSGSVRVYACSFNDSVFEKGYNKLKKNVMSIDKFTDDKIEGKFSAKSSCILYTSIPYDEGWKVTVDGEKVKKNDYVNIGGGLLGIKVKKGNHDITFKYEVQNLKASMFISAISAIILIIVYILFSKNKRALCNFNPIRNNYYEYEIRAAKKAKINTEKTNIEHPKVFSKEIIVPPEKSYNKEIIKPSLPVNYTIEDIETNKNGE